MPPSDSQAEIDRGREGESEERLSATRQGALTEPDLHRDVGCHSQLAKPPGFSYSNDLIYCKAHFRDSDSSSQVQFEIVKVLRRMVSYAKWKC